MLQQYIAYLLQWPKYHSLHNENPLTIYFWSFLYSKVMFTLLVYLLLLYFSPLVESPASSLKTHQRWSTYHKNRQKSANSSQKAPKKPIPKTGQNGSSSKGLDVRCSSRLVCQAIAKVFWPKDLNLLEPFRRFLRLVWTKSKAQPVYRRVRSASAREVRAFSQWPCKERRPRRPTRPRPCHYGAFWDGEMRWWGW